MSPSKAIARVHAPRGSSGQRGSLTRIVDIQLLLSRTRYPATPIPEMGNVSCADNWNIIQLAHKEFKKESPISNSHRMRVQYLNFHNFNVPNE